MIDVAIVGAGPYGLASASHLRRTGADVAVLGEVMSFWTGHMPAGMFLRSPYQASRIGDPDRELTLDAFGSERGRPVPSPVPLADFVEYGRWYAARAVPDVDARCVRLVEPAGDGWIVHLDDEELRARRVVLATGLAAFPARPEGLRRLPAPLAVHTDEITEPAAYAGERVVVVGSGQGGIETAALLAEAGADVEVVARARRVRWLSRSAVLHRAPRVVHPALYPAEDVGPPGLNQLVRFPALLAKLPRATRDRITRRCIRPAAAAWLVDRTRGVRMTTQTEVLHAEHDADGLELVLSDGTERRVDRVVLATGYRVDARTHPLLPPAVRAQLSVHDGHPLLGRGFESSVPGLHFVGAPALASYGPVVRFVSGTWLTGPGLAAHVAADARRRRAVARPVAAAAGVR